MKKVHIYTDGACLGNPGPGGWAAILVLPGTEHRRELCGGFRLTTNNRMEILAAIKGLGALRQRCEVEIYTDSQYLGNAFQKGWVEAWRRSQWRKKGGKPLPNADLWRVLAALEQNHATRFIWIRGHAGHAENERCDQLAKQQAQQGDLPPDNGYEANLL